VRARETIAFPTAMPTPRRNGLICGEGRADCLALAPAKRPAGCSAADVPKAIRERAWTSPIVYRPASR
jgi:hypothetical protein